MEPLALIVVFAVLVFGTLVAAMTRYKRCPADQILVIFGKVKEGKVVEYTFNFGNSGNSTLKIKDIKTSCGCTAALVSSEVLKPGEQGTLKVELDTSNRNGKMSRTITIESNDPRDPKKILTVYADIQQ